MKKFLITFLFFPFFINAQEHLALKATLTDQYEVPILYGDVLLYKNTTLVKHTTINKGTFSMDEIPSGTYTLKISCLGYEPIEKTMTLYKNVQLNLVLHEIATALDEIQLQVVKKLITYEQGSTLIHIEKSILSKETSSIALLAKIPNIQISADEREISLIGKGIPLLYFGGQKISMDDFKSISVDDIKKIEIINTPPSRYEANGRAVILIHRKKSNTRGTAFSLTEKIAKKTYFNNYLGAFLTHKRDQLELKLDGSYNQLNVWESNGASYVLPMQQTASDYLVTATTNRTQFIVGGGMYYQFNKANYLSFGTRFRTQHEPFSIDTETRIINQAEVQDILTLSDNRGTRQFMSSNVNYTREFKQTGSLFLGGQYTTYKKGVDNTIFNHYTSPPSSTTLNRHQDFDVETFTGKADLMYPVQKRTTLEAGFNYASTLSTSGVVLEGTKTTSSYNEHIYGVYSDISYHQKKLELRLGLRIENTQVRIENQPTPVKQLRTSNLFPKLNVTYKLDSTQSLNFNYGTSINRPNYTTVTSTSAFINPALEFRGAIELKPTLTDELSAVFQVHNYRFTARYFSSKNPVYYSISYDDQTAKSIMSPKNFNREVGYSFATDIPVSYKFWTANNSLSVQYTNLKDERSVARKATPFLYFSTQHQFKITSLSSFHITAWGQTKRTEGIFNRYGQLVFNAAFQTRLFKHIDLTISYNDIFANLTYKDDYTIDHVTASSLFYTDVNELGISLKYSFDAIKRSAYKNKDVDDQLHRVR